LYRDVADIRTTDLGAAVSRLNSAYSAEGVTITSDERQIVVRPTSVEGVASGDVDSP
jgi:hypothetical protein